MIDFQRLVDSIIAAAEEGVEQSLNEIATDARRLAPVRKLFKGGGRRAISAHIGVHNHEVTGKPYSMAKRVGRTLEGEFVRGAPNSSAPVTRRLKAGRLGGQEFREVEREPGFNVAFRFRLGRHRIAGKQILARARRDLARGAGLHVLPGGKSGVEYGGTLRDSIEPEGPTRGGYRIVGYVKASAIEHGFNYAYAQEMGTAHNAPQPYLRPALRNYLSKLGASQRTAIKTALQRGTYPVRVVAGSIELVLKPTGGDALRRFGNKLDRALR